MQHHILVGTHQKTGTVWMHDVFRNIAKAIDTEYYNVSLQNTKSFGKQFKYIIGRPDKKVIIFDNHSAFPDQCFALDHRGIRLIRDPRDMAISAARYHQTTKAKFANKPRADLGGKSLRAHISALPSFEEKLLFEIDYAIKNNIDDMYKYRFDGEHLKPVKYESLIDDSGLDVVPSVIAYLGLTDEEAVIALCIFWERSLFGLKSRESSTHIRSGHSRQYKDKYTAAVHEAFERNFPGIVADLAYDDPPALNPDIRAVAVPDVLHVVREALVAERGTVGVDRALERAVPHLDRPGALYAGYARYLLGNGEAARAEDYAWRALELDETAPEASIVLGDVRTARDDRRGAERAYLTALTLAPESAVAARRLAATAEPPALTEAL
jgi:hypothetical protein